MNSKTNDYAKVLIDGVKGAIENWFNLIFANSNNQLNNSEDKKINFSFCLKDGSGFGSNNFDNRVIELGMNKGSNNSGVQIAGVLQELFESILLDGEGFTQEGFDKVTVQKVTSDDFCLNLRDIIYNKMFAFQSNKRKQEKLKKSFGLGIGLLNKNSNSDNNINNIENNKPEMKQNQAFDFINSLKKEVEKKQVDSTVSTKIESRDSRRVMNMVIDEIFGNPNEKSSNYFENFLLIIF
jgi:hypothetical protein